MDEFMFQFQQSQCFDKVAITATGCLGPCGTGTNVLVYPKGILLDSSVERARGSGLARDCNGCFSRASPLIRQGGATQ